MGTRANLVRRNKFTRFWTAMEALIEDFFSVFRCLLKRKTNVRLW
jgi:hypothetical protein